MAKPKTELTTPAPDSATSLSMPNELWLRRRDDGTLEALTERPKDTINCPRYVIATKLDSLTQLTAERSNVVTAALAFTDELHRRGNVAHPEVQKTVQTLADHVAHHAKRDYGKK